MMRRITRAAAMVAMLTALSACAGGPTSKSAGEHVDDAVITTKVKGLFVEDKAVSALNIQVETFKGQVQLSGFANNQQEINRAVEIARQVKGVQEVKNDIRLKTR